MTYTPIAAGSTGWDVPLNAALTGQDSRITTLEAFRAENAQDHSAISWAYDPATASGGSQPTAGVLHMVRLKLPVAATATSVILAVTLAGATLTAGQNLAGLYDSSGNLLSSTADQSTNWTSTGLKTMALASPQSLSAGNYWVGFLVNGTTVPTMLRGVSIAAIADAINLGQSAATYRYAQSGSALTALPSSVTMSARTALGVTWWAALS